MTIGTTGVVLQAAGPVQDTVDAVVSFLPRLVGALVILAVGWVVGVAVGELVQKLTDRVDLDELVVDTPLGRAVGGSPQAVSNAMGSVAKWFVVGVAVLAAADVLAIPLLSQWIQAALAYLPAFIAGLLVIVLGFVVADFVGDAITQTRAATESPYTGAFATGTKMFLYFTAIVIGLDTMGVDVTILYLFARAMAWGVAAAIAIGVGVAVGWGGHTYVAENIDRWFGQASRAAPSARTARADGGERAGGPRPSSGERREFDGGERFEHYRAERGTSSASPGTEERRDADRDRRPSGDD